MDKVVDILDDTLRSARARRTVLVACCAVIVILLLRSMWTSDDALISFRSSLNLARGHGLRWNPDERVQVFTNPLWTLLVAIPLVFTTDVYSAIIPLHLALTVGTVVVVFRVARRLEVAVAAVGALVLSKAFVDFSSSGLENSLSHLLVALFVLAAVRPAEPLARLRRVALVAAFALVDRLDMALLVGPALVHEALVTARALHGSPRWLRRLGATLLLGLSPWLAWELFALVYFGFALPNTYYAKACSGYDARLLFARGLLYLYNSLLLDPATLATIVLAILGGLARRDARTRALALGLVLYLVYVVRVGGDYMSGRFLSTPLVLAATLLAAALAEDPARRIRLAAWAGVVLLASDCARFPTLTSDYQGHADTVDASGITDAQRESQSSMGLSGRSIYRGLPDHEWVRVGLSLHDHPDDVPILGGIGLAGYYAGDRGHIVDKHALSDPLLARLPIPDAAHERLVRPGHMARRVPEGYVETLKTGQDRFRSREVAQYYEALRLVTSGPLFAGARWRAIVAMHLGRYDHLIEHYRPEYDRKVIRPADLIHGKDDSPAGLFSYWHAGADTGVVFSDAGAEIPLDGAARDVAVRVTGGEFLVTLWSGSDEVGRVNASGSELRLHAARPFDRITLDVPRKDPAGRWKLETVAILER